MGDSQTCQSKKYLRQTLWQLQTALTHENPCGAERILIVDNDWISINPQANLWLDFAVLEQSLALTNDTSGYDLETTDAQTLKDAVNLYRGDLLEGWYQDWCLFERERIQLIYLEILYKLMEYCELHREYETGVKLGEQVLRYDRAQERTHYQLMRIYYLAGNRTGALRQYERCVTSLEKDLGVKPSIRTITLYKQIRADSFHRS